MKTELNAVVEVSDLQMVAEMMRRDGKMNMSISGVVRYALALAAEVAERDGIERVGDHMTVEKLSELGIHLRNLKGLRYEEEKRKEEIRTKVLKESTEMIQKLMDANGGVLRKDWR